MISAAEALQRLRDGNRRFADGTPRNIESVGQARRAELVGGQAPFAVIVATARTPIGRAKKGSLIDMRPDDLGAIAVKAALAKVPNLDPALVEDGELAGSWKLVLLLLHPLLLPALAIGAYLRRHLVAEGEVRVSKMIPGVGEEALTILDPGSYFGEMALIDANARSATAVARDDCRLAPVERSSGVSLFAVRVFMPVSRGLPAIKSTIPPDTPISAKRAISRG